MSEQATDGVIDQPHAERMDSMYRYQRHVYDLTRKYYLLGRDRMITGLDVPQSGTLLEVGCGTGRNLLFAQRLYPTAHLYGLDISAEMLVSARANFRGRTTQPVLTVADATAFDASQFGTQGFDRVMISYALSMIPDWEKAIDCALDRTRWLAAYRRLRPAGRPAALVPQSVAQLAVALPCHAQERPAGGAGATYRRTQRDTHFRADRSRLCMARDDQNLNLFRH